MKKQFFLSLLAVIVSLSTVIAQESDRQRAGGADRTKATMEKLAPLNLDAANKAKTEAVFNDFYATQRKSMQEMRASGNMTRESMKEKHEQLMKERDDKLKGIFTAEQMKKWKEEIEPSMKARPVPPPAPGTPPPPPANAPATPPPPPSPAPNK